MPIKLIKEGTSLGVGGIAVLTRWIDQRQGWVTPPRRTQDVLAIGGHLAGLAAWHLVTPGTTEEDISESISLATGPLAVISVYEIVKHFLKRGGSKKKGTKTPKEAGYYLERVGPGIVPREEVIRSY